MAYNRCDERHLNMRDMGQQVYPANLPLVLHPRVLLPACTPGRSLCPVKRRNHAHHTDLATGATQVRWQVCDTCDRQVKDMANYTRQVHAIGVPVYHNVTGEFDIFRGPQGAWTLGHLCPTCALDEVAKYHERLYGGRRRQPRAATLMRAQYQVASTCKCKVKLRQRYCFRDRAEVLADIKRTTALNGISAASWLRRLEIDPATNQCRQTLHNPAAVAALFARRTLANGLHWNACRCGQDIPAIGTGPANHGIAPGGMPTPAAMCLACDGVIVDIHNPIVRNYAPNLGVPARRVQPPRGRNATQGNLKLDRDMPEI